MRKWSPGLRGSLGEFTERLRNHGKTVIAGAAISGLGIISAAFDLPIPGRLWLILLGAWVVWAMFVAFHGVRGERDAARAELVRVFPDIEVAQRAWAHYSLDHGRGDALRLVGFRMTNREP